MSNSSARSRSLRRGRRSAEEALRKDRARSRPLIHFHPRYNGSSACSRSMPAGAKKLSRDMPICEHCSGWRCAWWSWSLDRWNTRRTDFSRCSSIVRKPNIPVKVRLEVRQGVHQRRLVFQALGDPTRRGLLAAVAIRTALGQLKWLLPYDLPRCGGRAPAGVGAERTDPHREGRAGAHLRHRPGGLDVADTGRATAEPSPSDGWTGSAPSSPGTRTRRPRTTTRWEQPAMNTDPINDPTFTVERTYPVSAAQVFRAFSETDIKRRWFAEGEAGRSRSSPWTSGRWPRDQPVPVVGGPLITNDARYLDSSPRPSGLSYVMAIDGRPSWSPTSVEIFPVPGGARLVDPSRASTSTARPGHRREIGGGHCSTASARSWHRAGEPGLAHRRVRDRTARMAPHGAGRPGCAWVLAA